MTKGEKAAKTRKKKEEAMLRAMGIDPERKKTKVKRKRKPMTPEQKAAAAERLAKAREARGHDGSASIHESIRDLPEDHFLHWKKVKAWIKDNEQMLKSISHMKNSNNWKERSEYNDLKTYIYNMKSYLSNGVWLDFRYGDNKQHKVLRYCVAMSYHPNGEPNRQFGVYYPDINAVWTIELQDAWYGEGVDPRGLKVPDKKELFDDGRGDGEEDESGVLG